MKFDLFSKLQEDITDFDEGGYYIAGQPKSEVAYKNSRKGEKGGYWFSQKDLLESIDLASASKFKKGPKDNEGQTKAYINIVNFYRDVAKMKININVANYIFEPLDLDYTWPVFNMSRKFQVWAAEESYDDQIDEYGHDLPTYGTTVSKKLKDCTERVPLRTLRVTQSAKSLKHAAMNGGYVILEDDKHYNEMKKYPKWNLTGLAKNKSFETFEYYTLVPESFITDDAWKDHGGVIEDLSDQEEMVPVQMVLIPDEKDKDKRYSKGKIVWMEKVTDDSFPLEECHMEKVDGRWIGRGEIEKQLENQIARNLGAHLRRRGMLWSVKKIYQSSDDEVQKNLIMEVADGEVIKIKQNGQIEPVNTSTQHLGDFQGDENMWKENSQQIAFAFNIATGENMPSGTSFSLGVVLERAVSDHFTMIRNTYSNFLKRCFFDQLLDIFRDEYSDAHTQQIPLGASNIDNLRESIITWHVNERLFDRVAKRQGVNLDQIRQEVIDEMVKTPYLFVQIPENYYENAYAYMKLNIDEDIGPDVQTLTSLYQAMSAKGDPRADQVLKMIFAKQGKSLDQIAGKATPPKVAMGGGAPAAGGGTPGLPPENTPQAAAPLGPPVAAATS